MARKKARSYSRGFINKGLVGFIVVVSFVSLVCGFYLGRSTKQQSMQQPKEYVYQADWVTFKHKDGWQVKHPLNMFVVDESSAKEVSLLPSEIYTRFKELDPGESIIDIGFISTPSTISAQGWIVRWTGEQERKCQCTMIWSPEEFMRIGDFEGASIIEEYVERLGQSGTRKWYIFIPLDGENILWARASSRFGYGVPISTKNIMEDMLKTYSKPGYIYPYLSPTVSDYNPNATPSPTQDPHPTASLY